MKKLVLLALVLSSSACVPLQVQTDTQIGRHTNVRVVAYPPVVVEQPVYIRPRINPYMVYPRYRYDIYGRPYYVR